MTSEYQSDFKPVGKEFTGRKMLIVVVSFFAVIIVVNLFMAFKAVGTFPGLEVKNSYVASQSFDRNRNAQLALGWDVLATIEGEDLRLSIKDAEGTAVTVADVEGLFGRATHVQDDQNLTFTRAEDGAYMAPVGKVAGGNWNLRMTAHADDGTLFQQRIVIYISGR